MASKIGGAKIKRFRALAYARCNGRCWYCNSTISQEEATLEHLIPRADGGSNLPDNLVVACKNCNNFNQNLRTIDKKLKRKQELSSCFLCKKDISLLPDKIVCSQCRQDGALQTHYDQLQTFLADNLPDSWVLSDVEREPLRRVLSFCSTSAVEDPRLKYCKVMLSIRPVGREWRQRGDRFCCSLYGHTVEEALNYLKTRADQCRKRIDYVKMQEILHTKNGKN